MLALVVYPTSLDGYCSPPFALPDSVTAATVVIRATGGYAPCAIEIDGLVSGAWQIVASASQGPWGHDGWGARLGISSPLPTALRARIIECGGQHIGVTVETS